MTIQEFVPLGPKTTMRIGGKARHFAELTERADVEEAWACAHSRGVPLIVLGGGSNTVFADQVIEALVVRIKAERLDVQGNAVTVQAGKTLATLINELAEQDLDLSPLTGIPGTVGGAIFGNAGQGPKGIWMDHYATSATCFVNGEWKILSHEQCNFRYRESLFKDLTTHNAPIIWEATLKVPSGPAVEVKAEIERLLQKRLETQPHIKTAGSCFKATPDGTPAWQCIDAAGLRGLKVGGIAVSEKHANFLLNTSNGTFADACTIVQKIREAAPALQGVEMRFYGSEGCVVF
jgi:UDP-N-acetylmuramate dehydrogenase